VRVWDFSTGTCLRILDGHKATVHAVTTTPDGRFVLSASHDCTLRIWDRESGTCLRTLTGHTGPVNAVAMTPNGRFAISGSEDQTVRVWELDWELDAHTSLVPAARTGGDQT
jgi:WD40 repeat protein